MFTNNSTLNPLMGIGYGDLERAGRLEPDQLKRFVDGTGALLGDVRLTPSSQDPRYTAKSLRHLFKDRYVPLYELGDTSGYIRGRAFDLKAPEKGFPRLEKMLRAAPVILLCICSKPDSCHILEIVRKAPFPVNFTHLTRNADQSRHYPRTPFLSALNLIEQGYKLETILEMAFPPIPTQQSLF